MDNSEKLSHAYFFAKHYVINKGYATEIDQYSNFDHRSFNESVFLNEMAWVILASGMNDRIVRKTFPIIKSIMLDFKNPKSILKVKNECFNNSLKIFNHPGKINAILYVIDYLALTPFKTVMKKLKEDPINFIQTFPYMGKATAYHFAKNIGIDVVKPDRHLIRISEALGFKTPNDLCKVISDRVCDKVSLIDLVIWRYATLDRNYLKNIDRFIVNSLR